MLHNEDPPPSPADSETLVFTPANSPPTRSELDAIWGSLRAMDRALAKCQAELRSQGLIMLTVENTARDHYKRAADLARGQRRTPQKQHE